MKNDEFRRLLESVTLHWQQSAKAYADYMNNGKVFRFAEVLKLHNTAVRKLLSENMAVIPPAFRKDAEAIIEHYTVWSGKWDELKNKLDPGPDVEFVFENDHRFPRVEAQRLEAVLREWS
ncbi:MAG: hypothetical protein DI535_01385 [Citrobacter freundii]|nr:MAG: hypothetical protein DI535_01385 [Citrobacter freundii]